ncbi:inositol monophosphatase family protein [Haloglomus litoreum]|uniref:inositol monophosphatase family protein n=1 Tax=Haloglomus litoreum TaxID=3034026 RepID=UPI0023E88C5E|nr:inositol monophosphatase [Haloglomus sp. DT116]
MTDKSSDEQGLSGRARAADAAARAGAAVAAEAFRTDIAVEAKTNATDFVTEADRDAQAAVVTALRERGFEGPVVGEEEADEVVDAVPETGPAWVVDPIDGTNNFVRGVPVWTTSVAAVVDGAAVAGASAAPMLEDVFVADGTAAWLNDQPMAVSERTDPAEFAVAPTLWWGHDRRAEFAAACREIVERFDDLRRFGTVQYSLAAVAMGALEGAITNVRGAPWDTVAGAHLVERAGGTVTDIHGEPWRHDAQGLVASNGEAHDEVLAAARAIEAERPD